MTSQKMFLRLFLLVGIICITGGENVGASNRRKSPKFRGNATINEEKKKLPPGGDIVSDVTNQSNQFKAGLEVIGNITNQSQPTIHATPPSTANHDQANTTTIEITTQPQTTTRAPVTSSTAPVTSSTAPVTSSTAPVTSSTVPVTSSTAPVTSSTASMTSSASVTSQPSSMTSSTLPMTSSTVTSQPPTMTSSTVTSQSPTMTSSTPQTNTTIPTVPKKQGGGISTGVGVLLGAISAAVIIVISFFVYKYQRRFMHAARFRRLQDSPLDEFDELNGADAVYAEHTVPIRLRV
uniref:Flocculation protein FLO11 n=1 Tax=Ciona intestinalis TaxID=7719 RepID=F7B2S4_CIOIN|nr:flocculation protein FLO11 isoform X2 [Ciona intestinalis]|eukprot:XP_002125648.1 flocculation protein FLO11 isoform X2 [Ciona intestinalis]